MRNTKTVFTSVAIAAAFLLSGCGGIKGSAPQEVPKVIAAESAAPSASPSPSPSATKKAPAPPAIKGVATDGMSTWMQTTFDKSDADWDVDMTSMTDADEAKVDKPKLEGAWQAAAIFLAEQGIDSELRSRSAEADPDVFAKWVADNAPKFAEGAKFVPGEAGKGNFLSAQWGIQQDDAELGITYGTGSKPRILERDFVLNAIKMNEAGSEVEFSVSVPYKMAYTDASGVALVAEGHSNFVTTVVDEGGEWKIKKNSGTFYPLQTINSNGTKSTLK